MPTQPRTIKLERTEETLTRRTGLILVNRFGDKINLAQKINRAFRAPGSNRGFQASAFVIPLMEMLIDGGSQLEDIRLFEEDEAYKKLAEVGKYPTSDAIGDWLRRCGGADGEKRLWSVISPMNESFSAGSKLTLDIDGTIIESDKGDAVYTYKQGIRGYHPLLAGSLELKLFVASRFQPGNASPQNDLVGIIEKSLEAMPGRFSTIRSDSAGYNRAVISYCFNHHLYFTITADRDSAVRDMVLHIPENEWIQGKYADGVKAPYHVAETIHRFEHYKNESFRLVIKRSERNEGEQHELFEEGELVEGKLTFGKYHYWIIATNLPYGQYDTQAAIHFHEQRGAFEKMIGELKVHFGLEHMPCGQFDANALYFTIGLLAFNLVQILKQQYFGQEWKHKSVKSLRYHWLHLPSKIISHARYRIVKLALTEPAFNRFREIFLRLTLTPLPQFSSA